MISDPAAPSSPGATVAPAHRPALRRLWTALLGSVHLLPVLVSMAFTAVTLRAELTPLPSLNDDAFHFLLVQGASDALSRGHNVIDFWSPVLELGFPQFLYYQHLPHITVVALDRLFLQRLELIDVFNAVRFGLLAGFPLTVYWSLRRMEFTRPAAATAAAVAPLFSGNFNYGFEYDSYIWRGFGMYTQLWAMHLSFICLALLKTSLDTGRGRFWTVLGLSALVLSHLVYVYMMAITSAVVLVAGLTRVNARPRALRFAGLWALAGLATSYFWLPFLASNVYLSASPYLQEWKYDSFGARQVMSWLLSGDLFDYGRLPVITALGAVGLIAALLTRTPQARLAVALFAVWLLLYFGRVTWGSLADLMPLHHGLLMHRFIGSVTIGALLLIAVGAGWLWTRAGRLPAAWQAPLFALATLLVLLPAFSERRDFYQINDTLIDRSSFVLEVDPGIQPLLDLLRTLPPGRTFAGLRTDWGKDMKLADLAFSDLLTFYQIDAVSPPYQSLSLNSDLIWDFNYQDPSDYSLFNVRYVVAPATQSLPVFLSPISTAGLYTLYEARGGSYFQLGRSDLAFEGGQEEFLPAVRAWHWGPWPAAGQFPVVELAGSGSGVPGGLVTLPLSGAADVLAALGPPPAPLGGIAVETAERERYTAVVQSQEAATLVLKVTYHPNWKVTIDGSRVDTFMVMPSYIGIPLPAGAHEVAVTYQPASSRTLLLYFGLTLLVLLGLFEWKGKHLPWAQRLDAALGPPLATQPGDDASPGTADAEQSLGLGRLLASVANRLLVPLPEAGPEDSAEAGSSVAVQDPGTGRRSSWALNSLLSRLRRIDGFEVLVLIGAWKLATFAIIFLAFHLLPFNDVLRHAQLMVYPPTETPTLSTAFATWDSAHYLYLADEGYKPGQVSNAFAPLYPTAVRALNLLTGDSIISGLLVSNVASGAGLFLLYRLVKYRFSPDIALKSLLLFLAFPTAFYLNLIYSEGLALFFWALFFFALYRRQWLLVALAAYFLPLTRPTGLFVLVPLAIFLAGDFLRAKRLPGPPGRSASLDGYRPILSLCAPLASLATYMVYMELATGDPLASQHAAGLFYSDFNLRHLLEPGLFFDNLFGKDLVLHSYFESTIDRVFFFAALALLPLVWRRLDPPLFAFCLMMVFQPALGSFIAYTRLVMIAFPIYIAVAALIEKRSTLVLSSLLYPLLLLQSLFLTMHVLSYWVA